MHGQNQNLKLLTSFVLIIDHENDSYNYSSITIHNLTPEILYIQFPIGELPRVSNLNNEWFNEGVKLMRLKEYSKALEIFDRITKDDPSRF